MIENRILFLSKFNFLEKSFSDYFFFQSILMNGVLFQYIHKTSNNFKFVIHSFQHPRVHALLQAVGLHVTGEFVPTGGHPRVEHMLQAVSSHLFKGVVGVTEVAGGRLTVVLFWVKL